MSTVRTTLASLSVLALCLGAGCAHRPVASSAVVGAPPSAARTEVTELEKTIADAKARQRSGSSSSSSPSADATAEAAPATQAAGANAPSPRCDGVCRAGEEICVASRRICRIAAEQSDPVITTSCQRAERDRTDASALCAQCR